jgi:N-acetylated-alpha-linked acidic dipeptidase
MRAVRIVLLAVFVAGCDLPFGRRTPPSGFTRASARAQLELEDRFRSEPDRTRLRDAHRELTRSPHPAGSPRDRELADWTAARFTEAGMQDVRITTHHVMLPRPLEVGVEMVHPHAWRAAMREDPMADPDTAINEGAAGLPYHAYSASKAVTAPVVYAGYGRPADYDWLAANGVDVGGAIVLVRYSTPYSYRGYKAYVAEQRGAAAILMYSDPAEDGAPKGRTYPEGAWSPMSRIERGGIVYDFLVPGDPLTPGWASVEGARRIPREKSASLPKIASLPVAARDARVILEAIEGAAAPAAWQGALPLGYRIGPGPARLRMTVRMDDGVRPIWTVTGMFRGSEFPDEVVIVGNHRDAWVYGGVDPSSGSAALLELARAFGALARDGWRPKRSILFASWDAEEFALTSSTEWGEQHEAWLRDRAVAYLNVDSAASGQQFNAAAVPSLTRFITEIAETVRDPSSGAPVATLARDRARMTGGPAARTGSDVVDDRLGGGSDYVVFLNFLGIPSADLAFDGPYGVYHSIYDTHDFVSRVADPGFRYHAALVQIWGLAALRLANADALPLDPEASAARIVELVRKASDRMTGSDRAPGLRELEAAASHLENVASAFNRARSFALDSGNPAMLKALNAQVRRFEGAFIDGDGLPGRPWYRHVVHAPRFTYEPQEIPGLNDAIDSGDARRITDQAARLRAALGRAAARIAGW